jgi:hypothetical protein
MDASAEVSCNLRRQLVRAWLDFSAEQDSISRSNRARHHRVDDAVAVLGIVNALRFASTRPMAGPSGIDDACARHRLATTRWWSI